MTRIVRFYRRFLTTTSRHCLRYWVILSPLWGFCLRAAGSWEVCPTFEAFAQPDLISIKFAAINFSSRWTPFVPDKLLRQEADRPSAMVDFLLSQAILLRQAASQANSSFLFYGHSRPFCPVLSWPITLDFVPRWTAVGFSFRTPLLLLRLPSFRPLLGLPLSSRSTWCQP